MAHIGNDTTPTFGFNITSNYTQIAGDIFTMPQPGLITDLNGYWGGSGGTLPGKLCMWDGSTGDLLAFVDVTAAAGSGSAGGQAWVTGTIGPYSVASGQTLRFGWWENDSRSQVFSIYNGGGWIAKVNNTGFPLSFATYVQPGSPFVQGGIGAYGTYTPIQAYEDTGAAWVSLTRIQEDTGAAWVDLAELDYDNGSTWTRIG